ncbi:TBC1 domain family member 20 isoform X1 [Diorhabda carinulata]|uniref:TBC1 domain family member 20 isoform X1 n=1 Tax=Diorhabda carinulata TaxID=1163345 RepID=UPI0025A03C29|nr:TBC1 domain family member 20 isoform X1 [Diorhabda carinulata]
MEHFEDEISSVEEETTSLFNNGSFSEKRSDEFNNDLDEDVEDTRSELKFDRELETEEETDKRLLIETALSNALSTVKTWQNFAISPYGLVADDLRCKVWPLLLEVDPTPNEVIPSLEELSSHSEYQQVVLDVNRSLKRFPPGIPYKQRLALQDQLTVLILRVIIKYPHLRYYQGYHDVAITFLLVVGEVVAFRIMEKLSTTHLRECMEPTMEKTSYRLNYIYALLSKVDIDLCNFLDSASVGTMFALPWYLTWFGHSLNQYKDVVRLYDFFLASPQDMSLYVATSLVISRRQEVFTEGCDMASVHCLLSQIPDNLNFEIILEKASEYYRKFPPEKLEQIVKKRVQKELDQRKRDEQIMRRRLNRNKSLWHKMNRNFPAWLVFKGKYGLLFAAATVLIGYIYYLKFSEGRHPFKSIFNT